MNLIESTKTYTGKDLDQIFFTSMLSGESAEQLGIRVLYNMPVPTTVQLWEAGRNILQKYTSSGWSGGTNPSKSLKTIALSPVKAEVSYSAADYFSLVSESLSRQYGSNLTDLSGTELERAETDLFKQSIAENLRVTMWLGDTTRANNYNTFDGIFKRLKALEADGDIPVCPYTAETYAGEDGVVKIFDEVWSAALDPLKDAKANGNLAYFVTRDLYEAYENYLDAKGVDTAYIDAMNGRQTLAYHGIPVVDMHLDSYLLSTSYATQNCILTDRSNLVLAVNTADMPGTEVRMWYNPDEMENRQRAVFMAGADVVDETMISCAYKIKK